MERFADNGRCLDATNVTSANAALTSLPTGLVQEPSQRLGIGASIVLGVVSRILTPILS